MAIKKRGSGGTGDNDGDVRKPAPRGKIMWEQPAKEFSKRSAIVEIHGDTGTGRTKLALTAPGPIALIHDAEKIDGLVETLGRKGVIKGLHNYGGNIIKSADPKKVQAVAAEAWMRMRDHWYDSFDWARSVVLDTHTELWELIRYAFFGAEKPSSGRIDRNWGPVNAEWRALFKYQRQHPNVNLIIIGRTKDEYVTKGKDDTMGQRTGHTIMAGQKDIEFYSDVVLRTRKQRRKNGETVFKSIVEKGWWNALAVEGTEFENEESNFADIMGFITETDAAEWR